MTSNVPLSSSLYQALIAIKTLQNRVIYLLNFFLKQSNFYFKAFNLTGCFFRVVGFCCGGLWGFLFVLFGFVVCPSPSPPRMANGILPHSYRMNTGGGE